MSSTKLYRVTKWDKSFETYETKKLAYLKWVPVPNKHDGLGFRKIAMHKRSSDLFTAWNLMLQIASRGHRDTERGKLIRDGKPLTAEDLAIMTGFNPSIFTLGLEFFSSPNMNWLTIEAQEVTDSLLQPAEKTAESRKETAEPPSGMEGKGIEGNGRERIEDGAKASPRQTDDEWVQELIQDLTYQGIDVQREFKKMINWCNVNHKQPTRKRFISWLNRIEKPMGGFVSIPTHREEKRQREFPETIQAKVITV